MKHWFSVLALQSTVIFARDYNKLVAIIALIAIIAIIAIIVNNWVACARHKISNAIVCFY